MQKVFVPDWWRKQKSTAYIVCSAEDKSVPRYVGGKQWIKVPRYEPDLTYPLFGLVSYYHTSDD